MHHGRPEPAPALARLGPRPVRVGIVRPSPLDGAGAVQQRVPQLRRAGRFAGSRRSARSTNRSTTGGRSGRSLVSASGVAHGARPAPRRLGAEGVRAGQRLVHHQRGGADVGGAADVLAQRLLRRHVRKRAEQAIVDGRVRAGTSAIPKSVSFRIPSSRTSTFPGFTSRWTTPRACAWRVRRRRRRPHAAPRRRRACPAGTRARGRRRAPARRRRRCSRRPRRCRAAGRCRVIERRGDAHLAARAAEQAFVARDRLQRDGCRRLVDGLEDGAGPADPENPQDPEASGDDPLGKQRRHIGCLAPRSGRQPAPPVREGRVVWWRILGSDGAGHRFAMLPFLSFLKSSTSVASSHLRGGGAARAYPDGAVAVAAERESTSTRVTPRLRRRWRWPSRCGGSRWSRHRDRRGAPSAAAGASSAASATRLRAIRDADAG